MKTTRKGFFKSILAGIASIALGKIKAAEPISEYEKKFKENSVPKSENRRATMNCSGVFFPSLHAKREEVLSKLK